MKRKKLTIAGSLLLAAGLTFSCAGCSLFSAFRADKNFAYDGAVAGGYEGTESEWISSFDTASTYERELYEDAKENGYEGTYFDFLLELTAKEPDDSVSVAAAMSSVVKIRAAFTMTYNSGAGIIYSLDKTTGSAYVVTNYHVVYSTRTRSTSNNISLFLYGSETNSRAITASFYGGAMDYDIAVLRVSNSSVLRETAANPVTATAATIGDSDSLTIGERVYALGNPNGEGLSVTSGVVSVTAEQISIARADESKSISLVEIRTDAAVNHGNSGGGLFNAKGELVGIVNARRESETDASGNEVLINGFGYAIPSNLVFSLVRNLLDNNGSALLARLGITLLVEDSKGVYDEQTAKYYIEHKLVINSLETTGAAYRSGLLQKDDTIVKAEVISSSGETKSTLNLLSLYSFGNVLFDIRFGDTLVLTASRSGEFFTVNVKFDKSNYFVTVT